MAIQKKFFLIFFIILLIPCILLKTYQKLHIKNSIISNSIDPQSPEKNQWIYWLEDQEKQIWNEITTVTDLTPKQCALLKNEWLYDYLIGEAELHKAEIKTTPISKKTHDTIDSILGDFGLSTKELPLASWKDNSAAGATDSKLLINEKAFNKLPYEAKKFLIGHEVQHFLHKDTSTRYVLDRFYSPEEDLDKNHPLNKLYRFQELRADIQSALTGPEYIQGYISFVEILAQNGETKGITHPKNSTRLSMGKKLLNNIARA